MSNINIREMSINDYDGVMQLWRNTEGVGLSNSDSKENIDYYLRRNPGLSLIATLDDTIVGAILCGHDGRRGYIHHLAVYKSFRRHGIGTSLVDCCLEKLNKVGIEKCHLFVFDINDEGIAFWEGTGWVKRLDLNLMSRYTDR